MVMALASTQGYGSGVHSWLWLQFLLKAIASVFNHAYGSGLHLRLWLGLLLRAMAALTHGYSLGFHFIHGRAFTLSPMAMAPGFTHGNGSHQRAKDFVHCAGARCLTEHRTKAALCPPLPLPLQSYAVLTVTTSRTDVEAQENSSAGTRHAGNTKIFARSYGIVGGIIQFLRSNSNRPM